MRKASHGRIHHIEEILNNEQLHHQSVRVTGRVIRYDAHQNVVVLESPQNQVLLVETHLLTPAMEFTIGSLYQFIGETYITNGQQTVQLCARVGRNVDGLNLSLYEQALEAQRRFLAITTTTAA